MKNYIFSLLLFAFVQRKKDERNGIILRYKSRLPIISQQSNIFRIRSCIEYTYMGTYKLYGGCIGRNFVCGRLACLVDVLAFYCEFQQTNLYVLWASRRSATRHALITTSYPSVLHISILSHAHDIMRLYRHIVWILYIVLL